MSVLDILKQHEDRLLDRISRLEKQVQELETKNKKLEEKTQHQYAGFRDLLLNRITTPEDLEFDGRDFPTDLRTLVIKTIEWRESGNRERDEDGWLIPYRPHSGRVHMWLDQDAGFKNFPTLEETRAHVDQRSKWVDALLVELRKMM